jgi:hypothetical protein
MIRRATAGHWLRFRRIWDRHAAFALLASRVLGRDGASAATTKKRQTAQARLKAGKGVLVWYIAGQNGILRQQRAEKASNQDRHKADAREASGMIFHLRLQVSQLWKD